MPDEVNGTQTESNQGFPAPEDLAENVCRKVKELRVARGWSLVELASRCGVSRSMLSQIERAKANPTLAVALRIAQAFGLSLGELVDTPEGGNAIEVIRADDPAFHYRSDRDCRIRTLSPLHLEKDVEFYEVCLRAGGELRSAAHFEGTREFLTVEKGCVQVASADDVVELGPGDSASYRADVAHAITNAGCEDALLFLVDIYR
ncbi:MAG: helix-turn-helix transcriptional regulator [Pirellulaceae bacterium]|nr:helix-turn-helix transcriptional regulator [Pirellulaceae bacterium]